MLCPETWNFQAPACDFKFEKSDISRNSCTNTINNFSFNHLVSLTVPDVLNIPKTLSDILLNDCEYYKICNLNISELISNIFINCFVKSGVLTLLSINTRIDCDDCVVLIPGKKLIFSLTKESYQTLGLDGTVSHFCTNNKYKYIVKVDLTKLVSGTKIFERTKSCLKRLKPFDVILTWEPPDEQVCPSSIAKYFDTLKYDIKECSPKHSVQLRYSVKAPEIDFVKCDRHSCGDYLEWLGMLSLNADLEVGSPDDYISTYQVPEPSTTFGQVRTVLWTGFFSSHKIQLLFNELVKYQQENSKPWISLYVQGFSDSVVNWREREHHYYTNGDNSYTIFMSSTNCIICCNMCSFKRYNKKRKE